MHPLWQHVVEERETSKIDESLLTRKLRKKQRENKLSEMCVQFIGCKVMIEFRGESRLCVDNFDPLDENGGFGCKNCKTMYKWCEKFILKRVRKLQSSSRI